VKFIKTAVILAAGRGTRLKDLGKDIPKGFLRLGEKPIIQESIEKLAAVGIVRVVIVTGHVAEKYEELAASSRGRIVTVHNDVYADSGSLYSLYLAGKELEPGEGFLLLESDLVYEPRALDVLLTDPRPDLVLVSGRTDSGDEVWVETRGGNLVALSKDRSRLGQGNSAVSMNPDGAKSRPDTEIIGELVGISKISGPLYSALSKTAENLFEKSLHVEYETGLMETARTYPIPCLLVPDLRWAEIDDEKHLERARKVYGMIR